MPITPAKSAIYNKNLSKDVFRLGTQKPTNAIRFVKRVYIPKVFGFAIGLLPIAVHFYGGTLSVWLWAALLFWCLVWPHVAYILAVNSKDPFQREVNHLFLDAFIVGLWVPLMSFNFIPSLAILSMHILSMMTIMGLRKAFFGLLVEFLGILVAITIVGIEVNLHSEVNQILASIPLLIIHPLLVGYNAYELSLQLAAKQSKLRSLSQTDGLTGLNNRHYWEIQLEQSFKLNQREQNETSIIFLDVDHFKQINDQYGHIAGDEVLQKIASLILGVARETDICGRYGGEEFCILMPKTDKDSAEILAERLRIQIADSVLHEQHQIKSSVSLGIAEISATMLTYSDWLTSADNALYQAKENGRNRTVVAESPASKQKIHIV